MNAFAVVVALCGLLLLTDAYPMLSMPQFPASNYDSKIKRNNDGFPLTDDDVLQLEYLKAVESTSHHETPTPVTIAPNKSNVEKLPDLEHQLESAKPNSDVIVGINPPHAPHSTLGHATQDHNMETTTSRPISSATGPSMAKQFHGAARLAFGQNPEVLPTFSTTFTTSADPTTKTTPATTAIINDLPETNSEAEVVTSVFVQNPSSETTISMSDLEKSQNTQHSGQDVNDQPKSAADVEKNINVSPLNTRETTELELLETAKIAARRSASIMSSKVAERLLEHFDGQYSAFDMAQYVFWTGDETGVARAVEELIQRGLMTRENALKFLREIRMGIEYLERSYANRVMPVDFRQNHIKKSYTMHPHLVATPSTTTERITIPTEKPLLAFVPLWRNSKQFDSAATWSKLQELNANEGGSAGDYDEASGRAKIAEFLYTEYTLEEILYKLAKVMFTQSLAHGSDEAQKELQKLTDFLEREGKLGVIPTDLQKKVLNTLLTALSDTLNEHPELLPAASSNLAVQYNKLEE